MEFLSHLYLPGAVTLWCALFFALASLWGYAEVLRGDEASRRTWRPFARRAYGFFALSIALAALVMAISLIRRDFRIEYVYQYSGLDLPWFFQFAAFWAGQKGSFLIWLFWGAVLGIPLARSAGKHEAPVMGVYTLTALGLLLVLVRESPFLMLEEAVRTGAVPVDGKGLNPLLQDSWMVIHPPVMFIGYAAAAIPFAFAISALWRRDYDSWARRAFPWALTGFLVLGAAILMGGYWAYKTLGWGGYWGWDPVENASLIPWLLGTALIHGLHLERSKGRYRRANLVLSCLVFLSVLYGTFLTRSGVLADFSVHSFVDLGITGWLVGFMAVFGGMSLYLLATRWRSIPSRRSEDPMLSRGTFMVLATIVILASAVVVTVGTSAPLLTAFMENPGQVGPEFYNRVNLPIALLVALLLALVPFLTWRGEEPAKVVRKLIPSALFAVVVTVISAVVAVRDPFHLFFIFLATLALGTNLHKTLLLARSGGLAASGGYLAHVGVGVILLGIIASSAYDVSSKVTLEQGTPRQVGDLTLTFNRFVPRGTLPEECGAKECMEVEVAQADGSRYFSYPKLFINDRTRQLMANPHIRKHLAFDLYVSPIEYDPGVPAGAPQAVQLAKGDAARVGDAELEFLGFDLNADGDAHAQLTAGQAVTVGATVRVSRGGETQQVTPLYRLSPDRRIAEAPPLPLPGGGTIRLAAISPGDGAVRLELEGLAETSAGVPAKLALDVTQKPLINLVWWGLYVVLIGGSMATFQRLKHSLRRSAVPATAASPKQDGAAGERG